MESDDIASEEHYSDVPSSQHVTNKGLCSTSAKLALMPLRVYRTYYEKMETVND